MQATLGLPAYAKEESFSVHEMGLSKLCLELATVVAKLNGDISAGSYR